MSKKKQRIGGEFWYQKFLYDAKTSNHFTSDMSFFNGGKSCIEFILNSIDIKDNEFIALPCYLCPTIVDLFEKAKINYKFYSINRTFEINLDSLNSLVESKNIYAVFFINYFGFFNNKKTIDYLIKLKNKGILLIEDAAQCFYLDKNNKFIGDFIFNSYRKFLPIDGSILLSNKEYKINEINDSYFYLIEKARKLKKSFINGKNIPESLVLKKFEKAHKHYYKRLTFNGINQKHKNFLQHIPKNFLISKRLENYQYLLKKLKNISDIEFVFDESVALGSPPLSFPIYIKNRDYVRSKLIDYNIFAPIHWNLNDCNWINNFDDALYMSSNILSLPIDWRYDISDMEYLVSSLSKILNYKEV